MTQEWPSYPGSQPAAGFSADPATAPYLRASHADRAHAVTVIDEAYADGRLSSDEHSQRRSAAGAAATLGDLAPLVLDVDLPMAAEPTSTRLPLPLDDPDPVRPEALPDANGAAVEPRSRRFFGLPLWWLQMAVTLIVIWLISSGRGSGWSSFWPIYPILGTLVYFLVSGRASGRRQRRRSGC